MLVLLKQRLVRLGILALIVGGATAWSHESGHELRKHLQTLPESLVACERHLSFKLSLVLMSE